ncbi:MAG TPA: alpha/beta fold hydrolase [Rhizomicrobium sp.]|nr:alpha/beta fold hydrolase [Rhizomicrobium sp.]
MTLTGNTFTPYRLRIRRSTHEPGRLREHARLWTNVGADPAARLRCGSFCASDGAEIPYRLWPAREPAAAVLLLHGAFDYAAAFDEVGPKLAQRGFAALAIDQRGFGATRSRGTWSGTSRMAEDAIDAARILLERTGPETPLFIIGESLGGAIAVHVAAMDRLPNLRGLVLMAPGALASRIRQRLLAFMGAAVRLVAGNSEIVFERLAGWELTPAAAIRLIGDPLVMRRIKPEMLFGMAEIAQSAVREASSVATPALTVVGGRDELVRLACVRRLFDNLAGEKCWQVIADAPHLLLHWRRSNEILREAVGWMTAHLPQSPHAEKNAQRPFAGDAGCAGARLD